MPENRDANQRRARREQLRRQRAAEVKKLRLRLLAAVLVLLASAAVIIAVSRKGGAAPQNGESVPAMNLSATGAPTEAPTETTAAPVRVDQQQDVLPDEPTTVIHIAAGGDLVVCDETVNAVGDSGDYTTTFQDVMPILATADLACLNFEGILAGQPYGTASVSAPETMLTALKNAGVDVLQLANSKSIAGGISGLSASLQAVRRAGLTGVGAYATNADARKGKGYVIREVNGLRVALVAFTKGMDNMTLPDGSDKCVNLLYTDYDEDYQTVNTAGITQILKAVANEQPDVTIALLHWGSEYNDLISSTQTTIRDLMFNNGVDAILGSHPHYVQQVEFNEDTGKLVCYSLGDFFSAGDRAGTEYSVLLDLEITRDNATGETKITSYTATPIATVGSGADHRVVRLETAMTAYELGALNAVTETEYAALQNGLDRATARLKGE